MSKRLFILLIILMNLALLGVIFVQTQYISNLLKNKEKQFELNVRTSIQNVSKTIDEAEFRSYLYKLQGIIERGGKPDTTAIKKIVLIDNEKNNKSIIYRNSTLEESYKIPFMFYNIDFDSINISRFTNKRNTIIYSTKDLDGNPDLNPENSFLNLIGLSTVDKITYETTFRDQIKTIPVYKRVSVPEMDSILSKELKNNGISIDFEFAVYDKELATKLQSEYFNIKEVKSYSTPIFLDNNNYSNYKLLVSFPNQKKFLISTLLGMIIMSALFTLIIIIVFISTMYQIIKQRKISQIKTDFINNMTHEFKTPIATISLAIDTIKNPKIIPDQTKVLQYLEMIKEENKRMHSQVVNVLRISELENKELIITKEAIDIHQIIKTAISHVELIIANEQGELKTIFEAKNTKVLVNKNHFTNVMVNILDNAIKYSENSPKILVTTQNSNNYLIIKVNDQGKGMSKQVQKRIFEKFYREHTGNIHNVKGHGLGLAYAKRIIEEHQGTISVESEKDKGSTFTIKLPLIKN